MSHTAYDDSRLLARTLLAYGVVMAIWTFAWLLKVHLDTKIAWVVTSAGGFAYWTTAKIFLWILPGLWLVRVSKRSLAEVFHWSNWRCWLGWGAGVGLLIAATGFVPRYLRGASLFPNELSYPLVNVLVVAPVFEEFLMRGALLGNLRRGYSFWTANTIAALMFVGLHLPGWYFMGSLAGNLTKPMGGALTIFLLGLLFGYVVRKSDSVVGAMIAHSLNNLAG